MKEEDSANRKRISSVSELMKLLEKHTNGNKCVSSIDFNEFTSEENNIRPVIKFFQKLDNLREVLNKGLQDYFKTNLLALLITSKDSGKVLYNHIRNELISPDLIGGFLTAIQSFGSEIILKNSPIKELCYKDFQIKVEEGKYTNVIAVLLENPNSLITHSIVEKMRDFIISFELIYRENLKDWDGRIDIFEEADSLLKEFFFKE
ncbi:MAG: hypothetical protein ACTSR3_12025 [Candidatus Helarchaeota archaeon]